MQSVPLCGQMELSWEESLLIFPVKRPDVPCAGTDKQVSARAWLRTGEKQVRMRSDLTQNLEERLQGQLQDMRKKTTQM